MLAKLGLHGLCQTLAREGQKHQINVNTIAPLAGSRITEGVMPPALLDALKPEYVSPFVAYLCHQNCTETGSIFELGAGFCAKLRWERAEGALLRVDHPTFNPSAISAVITKACNFDKVTHPSSMNDVDWMGLVNESKKLGPNATKGQLNFKGITVLVTGSGGGLGRAYALMFGALGANVVVNDLNQNAANKVVDTITQKGGIAVANYDNILNADAMISKIIEKFGRIDVVVNNAGILKDRSFAKMKPEDWDNVLTVHLKGTYLVTKAVWPHMLNQKYGRIINTSSAVGLYGNFGQANYSAAKAAIIALSASISLEGKRHNILVNTIAPNAGTQMTATILPKEIVEVLKPDYVAPLVGFLAHESNTITGSVFEVGSGWFAKVRWQRSEGVSLQTTELKVSDVEEAWSKICDFDGANQYPKTPEESFKTIVKSLSSPKTSSSQKPTVFSYTFRDVIIYHLGIGFDQKSLEYVYEGGPLSIFPTFYVLPGFHDMMQIDMSKYLKGFDPTMLLHGEQYLEVADFTNPNGGSLISTSEVIENVDKGKGTVMTVRTITKDAQSSKIVAINHGTTFNRKAKPVKQISRHSTADSAADRLFDLSVFQNPPDFEKSERIPSNNAVLYRLSGDLNPLHM